MSEERTGGRLARVAVLVSGSGTLLQALLDASAAPDAPYGVCGVVSDRAEAYGLERARAEIVSSSCLVIV